MIPARLASKSSIKKDASNDGLKRVLRESYELTLCDVELQDREDLEINAQPEGLEQTVAYARARYQAMCEQYGPNSGGIDIVVESGAIDGKDIAVVIVYWHGREFVERSIAVPFPEGTLEEARCRGFKTVTAGDIAHEWHGVPANDWHSSVMPAITRRKQIAAALITALTKARARA